MCYPGFDTADPLTTTESQDWWANSPFYWFGYYLGGCCCTSGAKGWTTSVTYSDYVGRGWGLRAIYVGHQPTSVTCSSCPSLTTSNASSYGQSDAGNAIKLAQTAGFPSGATIFLDVEAGTVSAALSAYVSAWSNAIRSNGTYKPGLYAGPCTIQALQADLGETFTDYYWMADWDSRNCTYNSSLCTNDYTNSTSCTAIAFPSSAPMTVWQYSGCTTKGCIGCKVTYGTTALYIDYDNAVDTGSGGSAPS